MATVLEKCTREEHRFVVCFCGQKGWMQRIFIEKCILFTVESVCRVKRFRPWWQMFRWWRRSWNGGAEMTETTVERLPCCGFRRTGKAMGQVYQCWWRICREINAFSRFEYHMFYFLYIFVTCLLSLPPSDKIWSTVLLLFMREMLAWKPRVIQDKFWNTYMILADFWGVRTISNFGHKMRFY
jgi:hypothetical protein